MQRHCAGTTRPQDIHCSDMAPHQLSHKRSRDRAAAATSQSLPSAQKQGLSRVAPGAGECCCTQDQHVLGACTHISPLGVELTGLMCPRQRQDSVLEARLAHARVQHSPHPVLNSLTPRSRPNNTPFPTIPVCAEIIPNSIQTQLRAGHHTRSPGEQSAVVCRAGAGAKSH